MRLGYDSDNSGEYFNGSIPNMTVWNESLSDSEIKEVSNIYREKTIARYVNNKNISGLYYLDLKGDSTDLSGNGNNGISQNGQNGTLFNTSNSEFI